MTPAFRARWDAILTDGAAYEERRAQAIRDSESSAAVGLGRVRRHIAGAICDRWRAAGLPSARLVAGLPEPEPPHPADWIYEPGSRSGTCGTCGRRSSKRPDPTTCNGRPGDELVLQALADGVIFEPDERGLPRASRAFPLPTVAASRRPVAAVVEKLNRAIVWIDRRAAQREHEFRGTSPTERRAA